MIVVLITFCYFVVVGITYGLLDKDIWNDADKPPAALLSIFWPIVLPCMIGVIISNKIKKKL